MGKHTETAVDAMQGILFGPIRSTIGGINHFLNILTRRASARKAQSLADDAYGLFRWVFQSITSFQRNPGTRPRRLLAIYDLTSQPFSIGDILVVQEASLVVRETYGLDVVDFALVYDPINPAVNCDPSFARINSENGLYHLASVLPVAQVNPYHGSMFVFNSHQQLYRFIADNSCRYRIWPSAWRFAMRKYLYHHVFNDLLHDHFETHGSVPELSCRPVMIDWAKRFFREHASPHIPVTVQFRRNKSISTTRNLDVDCWLEFFHHCESRYSVKFVIVCALSEVDERLRSCPNAVIAKDHGTNIEQDLALIQGAAMHMGACSGPGAIAIFNKKPYLLLNSFAHQVGHDDMIPDEGFWKYTFATPYQRYAEPPTTMDLLTTQFARMWSAVDLAEWNDNGSRQTPAAA